MLYQKSEVTIHNQVGSLVLISTAPDHDLLFWVKESQLRDKSKRTVKPKSNAPLNDHHHGGRKFKEVEVLGVEWTPLLESFKLRNPTLEMRLGYESDMNYAYALMGPHFDTIRVYIELKKKHKRDYVIQLHASQKDLMPPGYAAYRTGKTGQDTRWAISNKNLFIHCMENNLYRKAKNASRNPS